MNLDKNAPIFPQIWDKAHYALVASEVDKTMKAFEREWSRLRARRILSRNWKFSRPAR